MYDTQLMKRIKSFLWRASMMALAAAVAWSTENIGLLELSPFMTAALGLALGEVSKWIHNASRTI